jgi:hypothetical protein
MSDRRFPCRDIELEEFPLLPIVLSSVVDIAVSPDQLFRSFEEEQDWLCWVPVLRKVTWTSPRPFTVGTTRTVELLAGIQGFEEFLAWEEGRRIAFRFTESTNSRLLALGEDYQIEQTGPGCRLRWTMVIELKGALGFLARLLAPLLRWNQRRYLAVLKTMLEDRNKTV